LRFYASYELFNPCHADSIEYFKHNLSMAENTQTPPLKWVPDETDLRLLDLLQHDASLSNQDLAVAAHTSAATCLRRVKRMVDAGVIERRVAILSTERLGAGLTALTEVTLDRQGAEHLAAFEARAVADAAVQQCYRVSPGPDFMLVLQAADMSAYNAVVQRLFTQDANVRNVKSFFSVHRAKFEPAIVLPATDRP
jgi:Lrp/AsnC family transcriptional regulator, leucine-responsive regulatory protein